MRIAGDGLVDAEAAGDDRFRLGAIISAEARRMLALDETRACRRLPVARSLSESSVSPHFSRSSVAA
jgi:hypothetical protein